MSLQKFEGRAQRLAEKIRLSKTPVPGLIMGLSGTDSVVAFVLCYEALKAHGLEGRLSGKHFIANEGTPTWFDTEVLPWLRERCPKANIESQYSVYDDEGRWAELARLAKLGDYWVVACVNATEHYLGTYAIQSKSASIWPIATLWKTDILKICMEMNAPSKLLEVARIPDCICGRDEVAAAHLELIDELIQHRCDPTQYDPEVLKTVMGWIRDTKQAYDFKERTPYLI